MLTTRQSSGTPAGTSDGRDLWRDWADPPEVWKAQLVVTWEAGGFKHGFFHSKLRQCMNFKRITVPFPQIFREVTLWFMLKVSSHPVPSQVRSFQQSGRGLVSPRKMVRRMQRHLDREQVAGWRLIIAGWWFGTWLLCFHILGMSSSQLTNSYFSEGLKPPTTIWVCLKMEVYLVLLSFQSVLPNG